MGASFYNSGSALDGKATLQEYQFRIGGRYFPASPVQNSTEVGGDISNGGAESWVELTKALNILGDYRLSCPVNVARWAIPLVFEANNNQAATDNWTVLPNTDFIRSIVSWRNGSPVIKVVGKADTTTGNAFAGTMGSCCFGMGIDLETSNGMEISGLNAEEQSDISLIARWKTSQLSTCVFDIFTYCDAMLVLKENNNIELIL